MWNPRSRTYLAVCEKSGRMGRPERGLVMYWPNSCKFDEKCIINSYSGRAGINQDCLGQVEIFGHTNGR